MHKGKVVLITGGSSGFGKATAKKLFEAGYRLVIVSRNEKALSEVRAEIGDIDFFPIDVTKISGWQKLYDYVLEKYNRLDILFNNAGGGITLKEFLDQTTEEIIQSLQLNLSSVIYGSRIFGELFKAQKSGYIINMGSLCSRRAYGNLVVYSTAKFGVLGFSKALHIEMQPFNVRVSCVLPGAAKTNFRKNANTEEIDALLTSDDVAQIILDMCNLPEHVFVEEVTFMGIDQVISPM